MPKICDRCYKETLITIMSMFNTDVICSDCKRKEREHPDYEKALDADVEAIRGGDYNFKGVGRPTDL
jgi:hypothetical protein